MAAAYEANGRKNAMKYFNCVHPPLLEGPDDTPIIQLVPPPGKTVSLKGVTICKLCVSFAELHLFTGVVNKIFDSLHKKTVVKVSTGQMAKTAYFWAWDKHKIVREKYYGKKMNGNQCDKLLDHADELAQMLPIDLKMYGLALMRFRDFKHSCFSTTLDPNWKKKMQDFESVYNKLGIGNFPKLHACVQHVAEWIEFSGKPLGLASEQTFEGKCLYKKLLERDCYFLKK